MDGGEERGDMVGINKGRAKTNRTHASIMRSGICKYRGVYLRAFRKGIVRRAPGEIGSDSAWSAISANNGFGD